MNNKLWIILLVSIVGLFMFNTVCATYENNNTTCGNTTVCNNTTVPTIDTSHFKKTNITPIFCTGNAFSAFLGINVGLGSLDEIYILPNHPMYFLMSFYVENVPISYKTIYFYIHDINNNTIYQKKLSSGSTPFSIYRIPANMTKGDHTMDFYYNGSEKEKLLPSSRTVKLHIY